MDCDAYRDQMLDLLYGEASEATRRAVEVHHAACASCAEEYAGLRGLRRDLASWTVPAAPRVRARRLPWPGLAAAAAVLLALGAFAGSGGATLRRDAQGWSLSLGRPAGDFEARLAAQQARHEQDLGQLRAQLTAAAPAATSGPAPAALDDARVLAAARLLVEESERRQEDRLRQALAEVDERSDNQRRNDLAMISASLSDLDSKSGLRDARTNELMGRVLLASQER
jgi:hypothetical protein